MPGPGWVNGIGFSGTRAGSQEAALAEGTHMTHWPKVWIGEESGRGGMDQSMAAVPTNANLTEGAKVIIGEPE